MQLYELRPQDLLFFRDARPMMAGEGSGGHGARWPEPSLIFDAIHAALWRAFRDDPDWHRHRSGRGSMQSLDTDRNQRFGGLKTAGLFPALSGSRWLFPRPADVSRTEGGRMAAVLRPMEADTEESDLPSPLTHSLASSAKPSKERPAPWWSRAAWKAYLNDQPLPSDGLFEANDLFTGEWTTGIGMNSGTGTQDGKRIYSAEYLRLRPNVGLGFAASLIDKGNRGGERKKASSVEKLGALFSAENRIVVGGQQRVCSITPLNDDARLDKFLPISAEIQGCEVKWVLLSPAVFPMIEACAEKGVPEHPGGWLPSWVGTDGRVKLKLRSGKFSREWDPGKKRTVRKAEREEPIGARLIAACIPKPVAITGWTDSIHLKGTGFDRPTGARRLHLAVPAGAAYYFEADSKPDASRLVEALSWHGSPREADYGLTVKHRRSPLFGEKGFGLGVCGTWTPYKTT